MQRTLIGRELGVIETQRVISDHHFQLFSFKGKIQFALAVSIVDECTVVAVNRVNGIWVDIRNEPLVLERTEIAEHLTNFAGAGVIRGGNKVLTEHCAFEVKCDPALGFYFIECVRTGGL